ncbi:heavy metal translocating P-type ATPase [Mammaliicoccus sciuri]|uniref:heavy metal translocating P-type ATPase n=1 Tax=Mammaliicoccus sciuri TaxID=1296 RepID=UPI002B26055D|nr:heavy metal translocating P-type ATPase [Mammaliicoccus sciuri]MEB6122683.1 cadmium-translocating P-type ATPase [Mammaliicoccus sciuri]MEB6312911.1 cadmium-translocating P-type ATPase [Mammaliicoccus sciuri]WQJ49748.1 heavy metal translocating P-type ATPase [Mammaliicoccus sciuri]WQJ74042.1 heavy metal translocating P-type ATPase [Mammaliicoccus sciuri]
MGKQCCSNQETSHTCCTSNKAQENNCCSNEIKATPSNNSCCTTHEVSSHSTENNSNITNHKITEEEDEVATSASNYNFKVSGMDCSSCAVTIEKALNLLDNVTKSKVSFSTGKLSVDLKNTNDISQLTQTVEKLGYGIEEVNHNRKYTTFSVEGMDYGSCAKSIEKHLNNLSYVNDVQVSFSTGKMQVDFEGNQIKNIENEVSKIGYVATLNSTDNKNDTKWHLFKKPILSAILLCLGLVLTITNLPIWVPNLMYILAIIVSGVKPLKSAYYAIKSKSLDMNVLMSVAVIGAILIGEFFEGAIVVLLFTIGTLLQTISIDKTRHSIQSLMNITPSTATVIAENGLISKDLKNIRVGEILLVKPGERVPLDGTITEGYSSLNQAPITGESIPVDKTVDHEVYAGSINENGTLKIRVSKLVEDTTISKIIHMVEEAQENKAPTQAFIDRFSEIYTPIVFVLALLVMVIPPIFSLGTWGEWFYKGLELLVIACPCALVISTPVAIVTAIGSVAKNGVLIKGGNHLEALGTLSALAFDKTGTLTEGRPKVNTLKSIDSDEETLLNIAMSLESYSTHPISNAIVDYANQLNIKASDVTNFENIVGQGIKGKINDNDIYAGNFKLITSINKQIENYKDQINTFEEDGFTVIIVASHNIIHGLITVADPLRSNIKEILQQLNGTHIKNTVMLTGDNKGTANQIAQLVGIKEVYAELMPGDKLSTIKGLQNKGYRVGMIGDGINDAPALAQSEVGIAMGGIGSDTAMETADVVLMSDDINQLTRTISISKKTKNIIKQNIYFSILIKLIAFILVFPGLLTLWLAVLSDTGATILVILNSLRLLKIRT